MIQILTAFLIRLLIVRFDRKKGSPINLTHLMWNMTMAVDGAQVKISPMKLARLCPGTNLVIFKHVWKSLESQHAPFLARFLELIKLIVTGIMSSRGTGRIFRASMWQC